MTRMNDALDIAIRGTPVMGPIATVVRFLGCYRNCVSNPEGSLKEMQEHRIKAIAGIASALLTLCGAIALMVFPFSSSVFYQGGLGALATVSVAALAINAYALKKIHSVT